MLTCRAPRTPRGSGARGARQANGCLEVLPYPTVPSSAAETASTDAYVTWHGGHGGLPPATDARGRMLAVPAGTVVALAPYVWHRSGINSTSAHRRAFMPQYSVGPVRSADGAPVALAAPL